MMLADEFKISFKYMSILETEEIKIGVKQS